MLVLPSHPETLGMDEPCLIDIPDVREYQSASFETGEVYFIYFSGKLAPRPALNTDAVQPLLVAKPLAPDDSFSLQA